MESSVRYCSYFDIVYQVFQFSYDIQSIVYLILSFLHITFELLIMFDSTTL